MSLIDIVVAFYCVVGAGLIVQGMRYLIACQFMHYHADALKERWSQLDPAEQRLMLALLGGFGAGMLCLGIAIVFIAVQPLRHGDPMVHWFMAFITVGYTAMLVRVTRRGLLPHAAPIVVSTAMCAVCVAASALSLYVGMTR
jgi:hypothetical protein